MRSVNDTKIRKNEIKELFLITCLAQILSEYDWAEDFLKDDKLDNYIYTFDLIQDIPDCIEIAATLFYVSHGFGISQSEKLATQAVLKIRKIWKDNNGCWPEEYRHD